MLFIYMFKTFIILIIEVQVSKPENDFIVNTEFFFFFLMNVYIFIFVLF